ncbi:M48 family metallopeptidase [Bdellovibrio sp. HCB290]|uniref:M48 family metallopeptidase n=1 Tax=Bdellovibrio sp. HCB290 TaxID=3394356 RepID=UPI0039B4A09A
MTPQSIANCSSCSKEYPVYADEISWCHHCNWNLEGERRFVYKDGPFKNFHHALGVKLSQQLFDGLMKKEITRPRMTLEKVLVIAFATLIHSISLLILVAVAFLYSNMHWFMASFVALPLVMLVWTTIPKPRKLPSGMVKREEYPTLYQLVDDVADAMKTGRPYALVLNNEFNAYYSEYGIGKNKKKVIGLGLPLLCQLSDEEIIAVISHETSHGANGDIARSVYVGRALDTLANLYYAMTPRHLSEGDAGFSGGIIATWVANLIGWLFSHIPLNAYKVQLRLLFRQQQEAEYLADTLAAEVCGTSSMLSVLEKFESHSDFHAAIEKAAYSTEKNVDVIEVAKVLNARLRSDHEKERIRRVDLLRGLSLDATHPPSAYRREYISRVSYLPQVRIKPEQSQLLRNELNVLRGQISYQLIQDYLDGVS